MKILFFEADEPNCSLYWKPDTLLLVYFMLISNRPGVGGAVLQTPLSVNTTSQLVNYTNEKQQCSDVQ